MYELHRPAAGALSRALLIAPRGKTTANGTSVGFKGGRRRERACCPLAAVAAASVPRRESYGLQREGRPSAGSAVSGVAPIAATVTRCQLPEPCATVRTVTSRHTLSNAGRSNTRETLRSVRASIDSQTSCRPLSLHFHHRYKYTLRFSNFRSTLVRNKKQQKKKNKRY